MGAEIFCRYRTARAVPLLFGSASRRRWAGGAGELGVGGSGDVKRLRTALQAFWIFLGLRPGVRRPEWGYSPKAFGGRPCGPAEVFWGGVCGELCGCRRGSCRKVRAHATDFLRNAASRLVMDAEIFCRYRTARAVPLLFGDESRQRLAGGAGLSFTGGLASAGQKL